MVIKFINNGIEFAVHYNASLAGPVALVRLRG